ncbi:MAG TPA: tetratricopeptide repeat protein [Allocoleopsis sp.]
MLIVVDDVSNYKELKSYLPPESLSRFKILITTRERVGVPLANLNLSLLKPKASLMLLRSLIGRERLKQEPWIAKKLCEWLGYLPLGLELVGRYLAEEEDLSLSEMLRRLERKRIKHVALEKADPTMTAELGVADAFELSWERLDADTQELGCLISLFALAPIPWLLVEEIAAEQCLPLLIIQTLNDEQPISEESTEELLQNLKESFEASRSILARLHLLNRIGDNTYRLHQLVREFFRDKLEKSFQSSSFKNSFTTKLVEIAKQLPQMIPHNEIKATAPFIPHLEEIIRNLFKYLSDEEIIWSFNGLVNFYQSQGLYKVYEYWCQQYLEKSQARWGVNHPDVATSLHNLAELYMCQHQFDEAEQLWNQALKISIRTVGDNHLDTLLYRRMLQATSFLRNASYETLEEISEFAAIYGIRFEAKVEKSGKKNGQGFQSKSKRTFEQKRRNRKPNASIIEGGEDDFLYTPEFYHRLLPVPRYIFSQLGAYIKEQAVKGYRELDKGIVVIEIQSSYEHITVSYLKHENCIQASKNAPSEMWDGVLFSLEIYNPEDYFIALIVDPLEQPGTNTCHYYTLPL